MEPKDFIFDQVYKGCLRKNVNEPLANNIAVQATNEYLKNRFKKPSLLIEESIKKAVKLNAKR